MTRDHDDLDRHLRHIAQALVDDGSGAHHGRSRPTIPAGAPARRRTAAWLGAAAASIAVAGVAALVTSGGRPPTPAPGAAPTTTSIVDPAVVLTTSCPDGAVVATTVSGTIVDGEFITIDLPTASATTLADPCIPRPECVPERLPATVPDLAATATTLVEADAASTTTFVTEPGAEECLPGPAIGADGVPIPTVPTLTTIVIDQPLPESRFSQADSES